MTLFDSIVTIEDQNDMVNQMESVKNLLFEKKTVSEALREGLSEERLLDLREYAQDKKKSLENHDDVEEILEEILKTIRNFPVVEIRVAVLPRVSFVEKISDMIKVAIGQQVVLSIKKEAYLMGGAGIGYGGFYREVSLRRKLDEYFDKSKL